MASTSSFRRDRLTSVILPVLTTLFVLLANLHGVQAHRPFVHRASNDTPTVQKPQIDNFIVKGLKEHTPQTRYYDFVVSQMNGAPDGFVKPMLVVNGMFPGPTIEVNQGDRLVVNVTNHLTTRTSIHWHGLTQNGTNFYDGTASISECGIPPGQFLVYNFTVADSGTTWYHSLDMQYTDGITGALIIHPSEPAPAGFPTWDEDLLVEMSDVYHGFSASHLGDEYVDGDGPEAPIMLETPDSGAINGVGQYNGSKDYFNFALEPEKTYRLRLMHTGSEAMIHFSIDNHPLTIIEADGTLLEPYTVSSLNMSVAQRYSVLLHTTQAPGSYWMRMEMTSLVRVNGTTNDVRGVVSYGVNDDVLPSVTVDLGPSTSDIAPMNTSLLFPAVQDLPPARTRFYPVSFGITGTSSGGTAAFMNNTIWSPVKGTSILSSVWNAVRENGTWAPEGYSIQDGNQFLITEDSIEVVDLLFVNLLGDDHPFHLHGHTPWIMGFGTGNYTGQELTPSNPLRRDTFVVPGGGWLMIRFVTDNPGAWALHCHIAWHMAAGMFMQITSLPSKIAQFDIPQAVVDQCKV